MKREREVGSGVPCRRDYMDADTEARENECLKIHSLLSRSEMKITWAGCWGGGRGEGMESDQRAKA